MYSYIVARIGLSDTSAKYTHPRVFDFVDPVDAQRVFKTYIKHEGLEYQPDVIIMELINRGPNMSSGSIMKLIGKEFTNEKFSSLLRLIKPTATIISNDAEPTIVSLLPPGSQISHSIRETEVILRP